jgi:hypothetical protein
VTRTDDAGPGGFDTQFFHDDPDTEDYALVDDGILGEDAEGGPTVKLEEEDLWAGTQGQLKRARPDNVHYAKKAKKVDVKRLKDNIWKGLQIEDLTGSTDDEVSLRVLMFGINYTKADLVTNDTITFLGRQGDGNRSRFYRHSHPRTRVLQRHR